MSLLDVIEADSAEIIGGEFSEPVTIVYDDGTGGDTVEVSMNGIFDSTFQEINPDNGVPMMSNNSRVTLWEPTFTDATGKEIVQDEEENWTITIRGTNYQVRSVQRDGTGIVMLVLRKNEPT